jgi:hypothetical protein
MIEQNRHQAEITVRHQLEDFLKREFHETMWDQFVADGYVGDYLAERAGENWEELVGLAERALERQQKHEREVLRRHGMLEETVGPDKAVATFAAKLDERERKRAEVLLKISMRKAAERPDVKRFRDERLGRQRVLYDEAEGFISSDGREKIRDRELADLARRLQRGYGWRQNQAAWFVLNGTPPQLRPLTTRVSMHSSQYGPSRCKITLDVAPWIPAKDVERAFTRARDQVRRGLGPGTVGKRKLEVLRFVEEHRDERGRRPTFKALLEKWNLEYPHWKYDRYRPFSKAYREARREVFRPKYRLQF